MTEKLTGAFGRCDNVKKIISRGVTQVIIELPIEFHVAAVSLLDAKDVWIETVPKEIAGVGRYCVLKDGTPVAEQPVKKEKVGAKPHGYEASSLYKSGFWTVPKVLEAIGTDDDYAAWIQQQQCIVCGGGDWVERIGAYRCEAAHVRTAANSGTAFKPPYSRVPMCHNHHVGVQHQLGLTKLYVEYLQARKKAEPNKMVSVEDAVNWLLAERDKTLVAWATTTVCQHFGKEGTGFIPPDTLLRWAEKKGIAEFLPTTYRQHSEHSEVS